MPEGHLTTLVRHLRRLTDPVGLQSLSDRQLLERFASRRDQAAFEALVQRHAALVLGACRRVLHHPQDAEDAFQATFLVLARKLQAVRWHESVAGWLYQTAYRVASDLRGKAARQLAREREAASLPRPHPSPEPAWRELCALLDQELRLLPDRYRAPLLLCYLEGQTRDQAADKLGCSLRTLERRLRQGRQQLRDRLTRRGLTLTAVLLAAGLAQEAAAVPAAAAAELARAAVGGAGAAVSQGAVTLAERVVRTMFHTQLKVLSALSLTLALLTAGTALLTGAAPETPSKAAGHKEPTGGGRQPEPNLPRKVEPREVERTEAAIAAGLHWLARQQGADGHWSLQAATENDVAATAFGLLPLLAAGETHKAVGQMHPYAKNVDRGLKYLVKVQQQNGDFGRGMYAHALATWALCEAYGLTTDDSLQEPAQRALDFIVQAQHAGGGWRYAAGQPGDTSVSSWHVLALKSGQTAGLRVPAETFRKASAYLDTVAAPDGTYCYVSRGAGGTPSMTAAGLSCRLLLGWQPHHPGILKGVAVLRQTPPGARTAGIYYYHYATRVMAAVGGAAWQAWEPEMRKQLLDSQQSDRAAAAPGSWLPADDPFGQAGGPMMVTSLSLLTLQACARGDPAPVVPPRQLKEQELAALWGELGEVDFLQARQQMRVLIATPGQSVPFLQKQMRPAPAVDTDGIARLISKLGSVQFAVREKATAELKAMGEVARPALQQVLSGQPSLELRRRVERLLEELDSRPPPADQVRALRGVEVLAQIGTPRARQVLHELSLGAPEAPLTREARTALERLSGQRRVP